jgi:hypothetical protein
MLVAALLALLAVGCGARDPGFRVDLPSGWDDETPRYASDLEDALNYNTPRWARADVEGVWHERHGLAMMAVGRAMNPPPVSLETYAWRLIRLNRGVVLNFELEREPTAARVAGAPAVIFEYRGTEGGAVRRRIALIRHGDEVHWASVTAPPSGFTAAASRLAEVFASWRWV